MAQFRDIGCAQGHTGGTCHVRPATSETAAVARQCAVKEGDVVSNLRKRAEKLLELAEKYKSNVWVKYPEQAEKDGAYLAQKLLEALDVLQDIRSHMVSVGDENGYIVYVIDRFLEGGDNQ
jgi:hypothetical protein